MKKYLFIAVVPTFVLCFYLAQNRAGSEPVTVAVAGRAQTSRAAAFAESAPIRGVTQNATRTIPSSLSLLELGAKHSSLSGPGARADVPAPLASFGDTPMPAPQLSFPGLANLDNALIYALLIIPPDMNGDVGSDHYVQVVNSLVRVYSKTGQAISAPIKLSSFFEPLGTVCSTRNDGLAIVQYDQLADRWLISQTCTAFPPFRQMVAVSKTGDPLGQYFLYEFVMPNVKLNDFPKFGVWPDGYYMSTDEFLGSDYVGAGAFAFDRVKMLTGDPTASFVYFNLQVPVGPRRRGLLPSDLDGLRMPPAGAPNTFASYTATEYGDPQDAIRLYDFHADFNDPFASTFTERTESPIVVAAFDPTSPDGRADIGQPLPGERLDSQSDRLNYRLAYRNLGTHESLVVNQTVRLTPAENDYRAGVRVYEFQRMGGNYSVREQSTIGDPSSSRWIAAAAQDHQGNLAVQYNLGSDEKRPSIFYTGKLASDAAGNFRLERALVNGTGVQKAFGWRWGEYAGMNVDPVDDCTFWMTNAYYSRESEEFSDFGWLTQIGSFKFAECTPAPSASVTGVVTNVATGQPISGAMVTATGYSRRTGADGNYGSLRVLPGTYQVTASARGFLSQTFTVTAANGGSVNRNFALQPVPIIDNPLNELASESCAINGAPEPGERVTYNISLQNTGLLLATNLTATIIPSHGIHLPGPPQTYGSLAPGGPATSRPFVFSIDASVGCGSIVTLNLELRNEGSPVGNISIPIQTGVKRIALAEKFDSVTAPALPAGWATNASANHQLWRTSSTRNQSAPNSLFSPAPHQMGVNEVVSPAFAVATSTAQIEFRNWYELETTFLRNRLYDGSVLEIKIGDGDWQDILVAGGTFLSGGYDGAIDACCQNPLAGRLGWSGRSGVNQVSEFITTRAKLPASAAGQSVRLRFRIGTDIGSQREGQYIDNLTVTDGYFCECEPGGDAPFDFDGDNKTDLTVHNINSSQTDFRTIASSNGAGSSISWGTNGDRPANADFDGDGKTDYTVYRPSEGVWYVLRSSDGGFSATRFGIDTDLVVPADYDADGKDDVAVFRSATGVWYILRSADGQASIYQFGLSGDKPVNSDFDGDGSADIAVWRPSNGTWYVARSTGGFTIAPFGLSGDIPVSGDFDGDSKSDLVVFRPSTAVWYLLGSTAGFQALQFGLNGDMPLQADFDGDGRADIAVFRPASKVWYHLSSSDGAFSARSFGDPTDKPVPSIYVDR
ncbi:MAG TPA: FG-GAP-like repeat-containing protein [Pyrinomonadaceae bacterium]|nr:FG-GAP-like repeat-containing protein [Pyrinomonadaceae bacterium]